MVARIYIERLLKRCPVSARVACRAANSNPANKQPDRETTFEDLQARISATVSFLAAVPAAAFEANTDAELVAKFGDGERIFTGRSYLLGFSLPNFFFHVTTAYDLLRHSGVPLGKVDFLGWR